MNDISRSDAVASAVRYRLEDGIGHLVLDDPTQSANTMTVAFRGDFAAAIEDLAADT